MQKHKLFFPNLDGLRFFSFLLVFFGHSFITSDPHILESNWYKALKGSTYSAADLGVSFFFVLSSFLITYLLMTEKEESGKINVPNFYMRRVLRIWPLYYLIVLFGFYAFPLLKARFGQMPHETADPWLCFTFLNNFNSLKNGQPDSSALSVLWSVAIEEQFYLVWPLLLFKTPKRFYLHVMVGVLVISTWFRFAFHETVDINEHTLGVITDMAVGGIGAYLVYYNARFRELIVNMPKPALFILYAICLFFVFYSKLLYADKLVFKLQRIILSTVFITMILEQNFCKNSLFKIGNLRLPTWMGKYTYGLYCYHSIAILVSTTLLARLLHNTGWYTFLFELPFSFILSVILSYLSYRFFESPFLKLKDRFAAGGLLMPLKKGFFRKPR